MLPKISDLLGIHRVEITSGNMLNMSGLGHIKVIKIKGSSLVGHNRTAWIPWGWFDIHFHHDYVEFVYRHGKFTDKVWKVCDGVLGGDYRVILPSGLPELVGTFRMVRE